MKHRLNKDFYAKLPGPLAEHIRSWAATSRVRNVSVAIRAKVFVQEDARYTAFSADCGTQKTARAAGEWAGASGLRPSAECPIPPGCTLVESGWFLGKAYLNVYHNNAIGREGRLDDSTAAKQCIGAEPAPSYAPLPISTTL